MGRIKELVEKYGKASVKAQEKDLLGIAVANQGYLVELNKSQLLNGVNAKGGSLGRYKSKSYVKYKKKLNPKGVVDLKLTGKFHSSIFVKNSKWPLVIDAHDVKTPKLLAKYKNALGVTPENEKRFLKRLNVATKEYYGKLYRVSRNKT